MPKIEQTIETLPIGTVRPDPNQPRTEWGEHGQHIEELAASYAKHGIIQPLEVDEKNMIILGECRWRAAKKAGLKTVPVRRVKAPTQADRLERQLIDDAQRKELSDIERRWAYAAAVMSINDPEHEYTVPEVKRIWKTDSKKLLNSVTKLNGQGKTSGAMELSRHIGISQQAISRALSYFDEAIPKVAREAADEGLMRSHELERIRRIETPKARKVISESIAKERRELRSRPKPLRMLSVGAKERVAAIRELERVHAPEKMVLAAAEGNPVIVQDAPAIAREIIREKTPIPIPQEQLEEIGEGVKRAEERKRKFEADKEAQEQARLFQSYLSLGQIEGYLETTVCPECGKSAVNNLRFGCHNHSVEEARKATAEKSGIKKVKEDKKR